MTAPPPPPSERERAWREFREALNRLYQTNPAAALAYLRGAADSLRGYGQALEREGRHRG